jgi:crotonobetainyl-CoA:carnitine CoA-transferase CaiB-like acyl-CoA transferase
VETGQGQHVDVAMAAVMLSVNERAGALLSGAWVLTFRDLDALQAQVSESNLAIGVVRSTAEFADTDWAAERGVIDDINDRAGGTVRMPGPPWRFSGAALPAPGAPAFQGEHNTEILREQGISDEVIVDLKARHVLLSRRAPRGAYD